MNYQVLEETLKSSKAYSYTSDEELINHFKDKFTIVPFHHDIMFIFHHEREFQNRNHIISLHQR